MAEDLLPSNATPLEKAVSSSLDRTSVIGPRIDAIKGFKVTAPVEASFAPWIVAELGLGPVSQYFVDMDALIAEGVDWQRVRGTELALDMALAWVGFGAIALEDAAVNRRRWHLYQIGMGELPLPVEDPLLYDAEYLAELSDPARSVFFRGFHGYDVRALTWGNHRYGRSKWGDSSGVRLPDGSVKWSFGRDHPAVEYTVPTAQRAAIGIDITALEGGLTWEAPIPWDAPGVTWAGVEAGQEGALKAWLFLRLPVYVGFLDAGGNAIGYRRPISVKEIGVFGGQPAASDQAIIEVRARTGFGDGALEDAATMVLFVRARPADPAKPGKLWLGPDEITFEDGYDPADLKIGSFPFDFTLQRTVREHVTIIIET